MSSRRENIYFIIVGTIGFSIVMLLSFILDRGFISNIYLFVLLTILGLMLERIQLSIGEFKVSLDTVVSLGAYLILGIQMTLWIIVATQIIHDVGFERKPLLKTYSNIGMFILMFTIPHYVFQIAGYELTNIVGATNKLMFILYALLALSVNWILLFAQIYFTHRSFPSSLMEPFIWDLYSNIIVIPLSIVFAEIYQHYSYLGIIVFSFLIISTNLLFRLIRNLVFMNNELRVVQEVSASISSRLNIKETTTSILEGINELVNIDYCSIINLDKDNRRFTTLDFIAKESIEINSDLIDDFLTKNMELMLTHYDSFILDNLKNNRTFTNIGLPREIKSLIYEPMLLENQISGCIIIGSKEAKKFSKQQLNIVDILASQAIIAMENARLYNEAQNRAIRDSLTGLYNQRYFFEALDFITNKCSDCTRSKCISCNKTSLIIFDIDFFKKVNDKYGHQTGDKILKDVAKHIKENVRCNDIVSRYGGEEFTVILPNTDQDQAYQIADRVRQAIEQATFYSTYSEKIKITVSGGISEYPISADCGSTLLAYADRAMYIGSKQNGRNRVSTYAS